uniref:2'-5'-oligoadenylate synthetase 1 domain-containing protein n=1 Tax=Nannospalax galili TaxID=1026970 RepID=A0A8C6QV04_NANGA
MVQELRNTRARDLDRFIEDHLLPDTYFRYHIKVAISTVCDFLKERCFLQTAHPVRVSKVLKVSPAMPDRCRPGFFLNNLTSFEEQLTRRGEFIAEIKRQLQACQREEQFRVKFEVQSSWWPFSRALTFKLSSPELQEEVEFDVLPDYDALGHVHKYSRPDPQVYTRLIQECTKLGKEGEFSTCFTELQRNFLKQRPAKLKSLIRLVKHWYQLCKKKLGSPLPPQYALELLTVYAWERGCGAHEFNTAQGFLTVLELIMNYRQLRIYWTEYYDFEHENISNYLHSQLTKVRPVVLDPADPTGNVAGGNSKGWQRLAGEAKAWLQYPCFKKWDGSVIGSWDVPEKWACIFL